MTNHFEECLPNYKTPSRATHNATIPQLQYAKAIICQSHSMPEPQYARQAALEGLRDNKEKEHASLIMPPTGPQKKRLQMML